MQAQTSQVAVPELLQQRHACPCCIHKGEIRVDLLQQFAADKLLELPQVPTVTSNSLDKFLARVPQHKTALLLSSALLQQRHTCACCRYKGEFRADLLQQFAADKLLELPQVSAVTPSSLDKFLGRVPPHKTTLLAFSTLTFGASIALRQAVQQTDMLMAAGRVQWQAEVSCAQHTVSMKALGALVVVGSNLDEFLT